MNVRGRKMRDAIVSCRIDSFCVEATILNIYISQRQGRLYHINHIFYCASEHVDFFRKDQDVVCNIGQIYSCRDRYISATSFIFEIPW